MKKLFLVLALALLSAAASAKVELPNFIGDNMVLQQQTQAAIWGTAAPGKNVTIRPGWTKDKTVVKADPETGKWMARIATPAAGGPYDIVISDGEKLTVRNVLIGEVWFCSGQSNMEMPVEGYGSQPAKGSEDLIVHAKPSTPIRMIKIARKSMTTPQDTVTTEGWKVHEPEAVANTSATAYFFAQYLQSVIDIPVGIIESDWGGSSIETWMDEKTIREQFAGEFNLSYLESGKVNPKRVHQEPCLLYNGQVHALVPYTIKGMLWYQGETNRGRPEQYVRLQTAYVQMMRDLFQVPGVSGRLYGGAGEGRGVCEAHLPAVHLLGIHYPGKLRDGARGAADSRSASGASGEAAGQRPAHAQEAERGAAAHAAFQRRHDPHHPDLHLRNVPDADHRQGAL